MTTALSFPGVSPTLHFVECIPWDKIRDLSQAVYDVAMEIIRSLCSCFSAGQSSIPVSSSLATRGVSVSGPLNLIPFYRGQEANNNGVTLDQILGWEDARLESMHNYIQWLFPLPTPSGPNPTAAILDSATIRTFRADPVLKNQLLRSFRRMLSFYGLQMDGTTGSITRAPNFSVRSTVWLTPHNHNFLRISRMIQSLHLTGLSDCSRSFFQIMENIYQNEGRGIIGQTTYQHWQRACPPA